MCVRLSDVSDDEVENCLLTPSEVKMKEVLWTALNQDYIDKQAIKASIQAKVCAVRSSQPGTSLLEFLCGQPCLQAFGVLAEACMGRLLSSFLISQRCQTCGCKRRCQRTVLHPPGQSTRN